MLALFESCFVLPNEWTVLVFIKEPFYQLLLFIVFLKFVTAIIAIYPFRTLRPVSAPNFDPGEVSAGPVLANRCWLLLRVQARAHPCAQ